MAIATPDSGSASQPPAAPSAPTLVDALRGFGVVYGPSAMLDLLALGSIAALVTGRFNRAKAPLIFRPLPALGALASALYALFVRPWFLHWGATAEEAAQPLAPGEAPPEPAFDATRAITIEAPVEAVWPWIAQLGQDRAGFYSYAWLENLAGAEIYNSDRVNPAWQERAIGELVRLHPRIGLKVTAFEPLRVMSLEDSWSFAVQPIDERTSRLLVRSRAPRGMGVLFNVLLLELPHFIMERKMVLGIKERAERAYAKSLAGT